MLGEQTGEANCGVASGRSLFLLFCCSSHPDLLVLTITLYSFPKKGFKASAHSSGPTVLFMMHHFLLLLFMRKKKKDTIKRERSGRPFQSDEKLYHRVEFEMRNCCLLARHDKDCSSRRFPFPDPLSLPTIWSAELHSMTAYLQMLGQPCFRPSGRPEARSVMLGVLEPHYSLPEAAEAACRLESASLHNLGIVTLPRA